MAQKNYLHLFFGLITFLLSNFVVLCSSERGLDGREVQCGHSFLHTQRVKLDDAKKACDATEQVLQCVVAESQVNQSNAIQARDKALRAYWAEQKKLEIVQEALVLNVRNHRVFDVDSFLDHTRGVFRPAADVVKQKDIVDRLAKEYEQVSLRYNDEKSSQSVRRLLTRDEIQYLIKLEQERLPSIERALWLAKFQHEQML